jgi:hypothetical protein
MAGERKGKTYEAITFVALHLLKNNHKLRGSIFWNKTPDGMTIEPDLIIGRDKDHPTVVFLITHSGSAKNSDMKFWRNMGELAEAKSFVATTPRVYNIAFDAIIKESLKDIQAAAFDGQLIVGDKPYGSKIQSWVDNNHASLPTKGEDKADEITRIASSDKNLRRLITTLASDLGKLIKTRNAPLDGLWKQERARSTTPAPIARQTFVRRGLSKLLIFEDLELGLSIYRGKRVSASKVPQYAFDLGLVRNAIGGVLPGDDEVLNAVELLKDHQIKHIYAAAPLDRMDGWLLTLRNAPHLLFMGDYVQKNFKGLMNSKTLARALVSLHKDPLALIDPKSAPADWPPATVWLFEYLLELIKLAGGGKNSYGYAQMEREASSYPGMPNAGDPVYRINLPDWVHRNDSLPMPRRVIDGLANALSHQIAMIAPADIVKLIKEVASSMQHNIVESKLVTYRMFQPLLVLLQTDVTGLEPNNLRTCFAEAAGVGGQAGKTTVGQVGKTLINWQSVTAQGRDHKKKELCGRAIGLRYSWDSSSRFFILRPDVKKLILVVDGTWRQKDLDALARAGWDHIFYPDEMDQLAAAIV